MYVRVLVDDGHLSQYSKTSFRIWGMKATCPFAGRDERAARSSGRVGGGMVSSEQQRGNQDDPRVIKVTITNKHYL